MANKEINLIINAIDKATWPLKQMGGELSFFAERNKTLFKTLAVWWTAAFGSLSLAIYKWRQDLNEYESVINRLSHILQTATWATDEQVNSLIKQAEALELVWVASKESIVNAQAQLATFDLKTETIEKLIPSITDYVMAEKGASATTADFSQMTNSLAQALNGNFWSLTRIGFVLDDVTKEMIENWTEMERATALASVLDSTYGWFNESLTKTAEWIAILRNRELGNLNQSIASWLMPTLDKLNLIFINILQKVNAFITENQELVTILIKATLIISWLVAVFWTLGLAIPPIIAWFKVLIPLFWLFKGMVLALSWPIGWFIGAGALIAVIWKKWITETFNIVKDFTSKFITWFAIAFSKVGGFLIDFIWFFGRTILKLWVWIIAFWVDFVEFSSKALLNVWKNIWIFAANLLVQFQNIDWGAAWSWLQEWFWKALSNVLNKAKEIWKAIVNFFRNIFAGGDASIDISADVGSLSSWQKKAILSQYESIFEEWDFSRTKAVLSSIWEDFKDTFLSSSKEASKWLQELNIEAGKTQNIMQDVTNSLEWLSNLWWWGWWKGAVKWLQEINEEIEKLNEWLSEAHLKELALFQEQYLEEQKKYFQDLQNEIDRVKNSALKLKESLVNDIWKTKDSVLKLVDEFKRLQEEFEKLKEKWRQELEKLWEEFAKLKEKWKKEIEDLKKEIDKLNESILNIESKWFDDIAKRTLDIEKDLKEITKELEKENLEEEKRNELLQKQVKLNDELALAKSHITEEDIQRAILERDKTPTQRILEKMELDKKEAEAKILQIQEEIQKKTEAHNLELEQLKTKAEQKLIDIKKEEEDFKILMENKKQEILSEGQVYRNLVNEKKLLDEDYFNTFSERIKRQMKEIEDVRKSLEKLRETQWAGVLWINTSQNINTNSIRQNPINNTSQNNNNNVNINMWWVVVNNEADENRLVDKIKRVFIRDAQLFNNWIL